MKKICTTAVEMNPVWHGHTPPLSDRPGIIWYSLRLSPSSVKPDPFPAFCCLYILLVYSFPLVAPAFFIWRQRSKVDDKRPAELVFQRSLAPIRSTKVTRSGTKPQGLKAGKDITGMVNQCHETRDFKETTIVAAKGCKVMLFWTW